MTARHVPVAPPRTAPRPTSGARAVDHETSRAVAGHELPPAVPGIMSTVVAVILAIAIALVLLVGIVSVGVRDLPVGLVPAPSPGPAPIPMP